MNITETFAHHARAVPDRPAIVHGERVVLYRDLDALVSRTAAHLYSLGLVQGDVAGVALKDSVEHLLILAAMARAGIVILPLDWRWTPVEQERVIAHFGAKRVLVEPGRAMQCGVECIAVDSSWNENIKKADLNKKFPEEDIPLLMSLSSGTTGRPKGPRIRHSQFLARYRVFWINLGFNSQDRFLSATPFYYGGGRTFPLTMLYSGGSVFMLPPPYEPEALCEAVKKYRISSIFLVPTLIRRLLTLTEAQLAPIRSLRLLLSSGSALHAEERRTLRALCPGFVEYYSSTEGGGVSYLTAEDPETFNASVGRPVFGVEVQCVDEDHRPLPAGGIGRIRYRGPAVADGFWNDPEASRESFRDGWWYPGDLGMLDEHGYLYLKGRSKDMIIRGGVNIYPGEIEAALQSHPAVADSAVVGWPSREFNEEVAAFVILKGAASAAELRELCKTRLAPYKVPREVFVVHDFPRNALGKVIKADLSAGLSPWAEPPMRIWHQSLTVLGDLPAYEERMRAHIRNVVRPGTEVVLHGMLPGTYPANYPGDDIKFRFLFAMHSMQMPVHALNAQAQGFDAFALCTLPDPMLAEIRTLVDIPVAGCGETCFHLAAKSGRRFGMLLFIDRMAERYREQIAALGLADRCVGVQPVGFGFNDVLEAFDKPGEIIDRFRTAARSMIAAGAGAIIPGEIPLNVLLASEGLSSIDGVPLIDSLGATLQQAQAMVDLRVAAGPEARQDGWSTAAPPRERVEQVLEFYGLGKHLLEKERK